jgi:hypothetical protein
LNNASIIAARMYRYRLSDFETVFMHYDDDIVASIAAITDAIRNNPGVDPYQLVLELVSE